MQPAGGPHFVSSTIQLAAPRRYRFFVQLVDFALVLPDFWKLATGVDASMRGPKRDASYAKF